jgi:hypothetical protein
VARDAQLARNVAAIGPRTGSAATAKLASEHHVVPEPPNKPKKQPVLNYLETGTVSDPLGYCPAGYRPPGCEVVIRRGR